MAACPLSWRLTGLVLRGFTEDDVDRWYDLNSDRYVMWFLTAGEPTQPEEAPARYYSDDAPTIPGAGQGEVEYAVTRAERQVSGECLPP